MAGKSGWSTPPTSFKETIDDAVGNRAREMALAILSEVVQRSPVGNPDLWKANTEAQAKNLAMADAYDARATEAGRKKLTKRERKENYFVGVRAAGQGYVGGRFRGNNFVTIDEPGYYEINRIDPSGSATIQAGSATIYAAPPYSTIYIQNNLPYSVSLETGHSTQAPNGVYGLAFASVAEAYR